MIGRSPQCYIPSFVEISQPVPEKKIFEGFFTIYGHGGHLGHVTSIISSDFHFLVPKSFHTKFGSDRHSSSEKVQFEFLYVHDLGQGQEMTLTFNTHISSYNNSIRCLLLLTFRSLAATVSEKINRLHFFL